MHSCLLPASPILHLTIVSYTQAHTRCSSTATGFLLTPCPSQNKTFKTQRTYCKAVPAGNTFGTCSSSPAGRLNQHHPSLPKRDPAARPAPMTSSSALPPRLPSPKTATKREAAKLHPSRGKKPGPKATLAGSLLSDPTLKMQHPGQGQTHVFWFAFLKKTTNITCI